MKNLLRKLPTLLIAAFVVMSFSSCSDDENPCIDENLVSFKLVVIDAEGNNIFGEESVWDAENVLITYLNEENEVESADIEVKQDADDAIYFESAEISELSLDGVLDFTLVLDNDNSIDFEFIVTEVSGTDCLAFEYVANDVEGESLETTGSNPTVYILTFDATEE
ncbi:hypothetical protein MM236_18165 [Belliella sp. DSM 107340]|uniref:DUF4382 domain-containing protein n=1 Tax=Belliella calami TaxID=2923436 RepID=A0ABS9UTH4_9BACT|nr:hypothetical protein [Belliella calami]MCH7399926.1 hypothetical protein [Belliella calami]